MTKEKLIRTLCIALVSTVLSLALILVIAFAGGMMTEAPDEESVDPHFRPFFPNGIPENLPDTLEMNGPGDGSDDTMGDGTLPTEPGGSGDGSEEEITHGPGDETGNTPGGDLTLPEWESGMEWPTLPPTLDTLPADGWPTLPEGWDTLPEEWETFPEEWGDIPSNPDELGDLLAGMDGSLGLPPGALAAGAASQLTVMEIYAEYSDTLYLKMQSFGNYTGQGWNEAQAYGNAINDYGHSALYLPHYVMNELKHSLGFCLTFTPKMDTRVIPYYITDSGYIGDIQTSDVKAVGASDAPYTLYYRPYDVYMPAPMATVTLASYEAAYAAFVRQGYLEVDDTTLAYMKLIIEEQGFDPNDPDIVEKVATYIQNAATYNLAYDQNLDREPNVALAFLGAYKEGVCRHYATAATLLYRALGIPARYTVGFMTDVTSGETTPVKGMDAHAWVEVYVDGFGWQFVEVTGSIPNEPGEGTDTESDTTPPVEPPTEPNTGSSDVTGEPDPDTDSNSDESTILPPEPPTEPDTDPDTEPDTNFGDVTGIPDPGTDTAPGENTIFPPEPDTEPPLSFGDLMAGADGNLKKSTSIPPAVWNGTVFKITTDHDGRLLLKIRSMGDYAGQSFGRPIDTESVLGYSNAYLTGLYLSSLGSPYHTAQIETLQKSYAVPYYVSLNNQDLFGGITVGDNTVTGNGGTTYTISYYPFDAGYESVLDVTAIQKALYAHMVELYTTVDSETAGYLVTLSEQQGWIDLPASALIPAVADYLRNTYLLNPDHNPMLHEADNAVIAFLDQYRQGSVRHFAAAATLIYRSLGIPARYTVGYLAEAQEGETVTVRGVDAYAWVEVFVEGIGWVAVDVAEGERELPPEPPPEPETVELRPKSMKVLYTGNLITHDGLLTGFEEYEKKGYTYVAETQGQRTSYGRSVVTITSVTLYDPDGKDVTKSFNVVKKTGELWVCMSELYFSGTSLTKVYDGTPLTAEDVILVSGNLPTGYSVEIIPSKGQTDVGISYAAFSVKIWYQQGQTRTDRTSYFIIYKQYGTLSVTPASLTVKADDAEKVYDGTPITCDGISITEGSLAPGDTVYSYTVEGSRTHVGRSENVITSLIIRNSAGEDVTRNYAIETVAGTLKVTAP